MKQLCDAVHGSILVDSQWCEKIIDTKEFQRLRHIEQTSMRSLFPSAHHDRFIHSLGTYHIACKIVDAIIKNTDQSIFDKIINEKYDLDKITTSYKLACLLHDCGHSPFSHTFEEEYVVNQLIEVEIIKNAEEVEQLRADLTNAGKDTSKPHEKISALIVLKTFGKTIKELGGCPTLCARMIIGCTYKNADQFYHKIANCFIMLLNGHIIDADRLDYIKRDKWATGYNTTGLDIDRLLLNIELCYQPEDGSKVSVCFHKSALDEIGHVIDSKKFQLKLLNHHKIYYEQHILKEAVRKLAKNLNKDKNNAVALFFNYKGFFEQVAVNTNVKLFLPTDDDIIHLLKNDNDNDYAEEYLSRTHKLRPLWKSYAEFYDLFLYNLNESQKKWVFDSDNLMRVCIGQLDRLNYDENQDYYLEKGKYIEIKPARIDRTLLFIKLRQDKIVSYDRIMDTPANIEQKFFYLFISKNKITTREVKRNLINSIKEQFFKELPNN